MHVEVLSKNWWAVLLRGVAGIVFGVLTAFMPGITLAVLVLLFGGYAIVDGIFNVIAAVRRGQTEQPRWWLLLEGLVSIAAGVVTFAMPGLTALVLLYTIALWALVTGVLEIIAAIRLRKEISNEWWLVLSGVLSVLFGAALLVFPGPGALAVVLWIGAYEIVFGIFLVALAFRLRSKQEGTPRTVPRTA